MISRLPITFIKLHISYQEITEIQIQNHIHQNPNHPSRITDIQIQNHIHPNPDHLSGVTEIQIIEFIRYFGVDLGLYTSRNDIQTNVVLLIQAKVCVAHQVKRVDDPPGGLRGVDGQTLPGSTSEVSHPLQCHHLTILYVSNDQKPTLVFWLGESRSMGFAVSFLQIKVQSIVDITSTC